MDAIIDGPRDAMMDDWIDGCMDCTDSQLLLKSKSMFSLFEAGCELGMSRAKKKLFSTILSISMKDW